MKNPYFTRKSPVRFCCRKKGHGCKATVHRSQQPATRAVSRDFVLSKKWVVNEVKKSHFDCQIKKSRCLAICKRVAVMSVAIFNTFQYEKICNKQWIYSDFYQYCFL